MGKIKIMKVEEDAHQAAKVQAAKEGKTLQEWISSTIRRITKSDKSDKS